MVVRYTIDFSYVHNRIPYCKVEQNNNKTTHHETVSATAGTQWNVEKNRSDIKEQMSCFPLYKVQNQTLDISMVKNQDSGYLWGGLWGW